MAALTNYYAEDDTEYSNTDSTTWTDLVSLTATLADATTDHYVLWSCLSQNNNASEDAQVRLYDSTAASQLVLQNWEAKEVTTPIDYKCMGGLYKFTSPGSPASNVWKIQTKREASTATIKGKQSRICIFKAGANDNYAESTGRVTTTSTTLASKLDLTFTPASTGDYLIIASAHTDCVAGNFSKIALEIDAGNVIGLEEGSSPHYDAPGSKDTTNRYPWVRIWKGSLSNASHTISIHYASGVAAATAGVEELRILAIRLDALNNNYASITDTNNAGTQSTYQTAATLTQTVAATDHLILACGTCDNSGTTVSTYTQATQNINGAGDVSMFEQSLEHAAAADTFTVWGIKKSTLTAVSHVWKLQRRAETGSATTTTLDGGIAVIELGSPNKTLAAGAGSYIFTGTAATIKAGRKVVADAGSNFFTGSNATLVHGHPLVAGAGSHTFAGGAASLLHNRPVPAGAGSHTFSGAAAGLVYGKKVAAGVGTYNFTGADSGIRATWRLAAAAESYAFGGTSASILHGAKIAADVGEYTFNGQDATLIHGTVGAFTIVADPGAYNFSGATAGLVAHRLLSAELGAYTFTGGEATFVHTLIAGARRANNPWMKGMGPMMNR